MINKHTNKYIIQCPLEIKVQKNNAGLTDQFIF